MTADDVRTRAIEAGARHQVHPWPDGGYDCLCGVHLGKSRDVSEHIAAAAVDAAEPIIRADALPYLTHALAQAQAEVRERLRAQVDERRWCSRCRIEVLSLLDGAQ